MIDFILKGLLRDPSRSFLPFLVISLVVGTTVLMQAYLKGAMGGIISLNARLETGHVKVTSKIYSDMKPLSPLDAALPESRKLVAGLRSEFSNLHWIERIKFGGMLDVPDDSQETASQTVVRALGVSFDGLYEDPLGFPSALIKGRVPQTNTEILIGNRLESKLDLRPGQRVTFISTGIDGASVADNFTVSGIVSFGLGDLDEKTVFFSLSGARDFLAMNDDVSEVLGFLKSGYHAEKAAIVASKFRSIYEENSDFSPVMETLDNNPNLGSYVALADSVAYLMVMVFILLASLVLWNAGVRSGIRRYSEFGLRMALGEHVSRIYMVLIVEALIIGVAGSIAGTALGLIPAYYLEVYGFDISRMMDLEASLVKFESIIRADVTFQSLWIGFVPGLGATTVGAALAGVRVLFRSSSELMKELES